MSSFAKLATITASTKRGGIDEDGLEIEPAESIASLSCLPLDPADPELTIGMERVGVHELLQTAVEGGLDIVEGDILVVSGTEYLIRSVADWDWKSDDFKVLILEQSK